MQIAATGNEAYHASSHATKNNTKHANYVVIYKKCRREEGTTAHCPANSTKYFLYKSMVELKELLYCFRAFK